MLRKITLATLAAATAMTVAPMAANARYHGDGYYSRNYYSAPGYGYSRGYSYSPDYYDGYRDYGYRNYGGRYYGRPSRSYGYRCHHSGTTGTILGALAGGLLGHEIAEGGRYRRGDGTAGTIIGGAAGALIGGEIGRHSC